MSTYRTPDFLQLVDDLALATGVPEERILEIAAAALRRRLDTTTVNQIRFHLGCDLRAIEGRLADLRHADPSHAP